MKSWSATLKSLDEMSRSDAHLNFGFNCYENCNNYISFVGFIFSFLDIAKLAECELWESKAPENFFIFISFQFIYIHTVEQNTAVRNDAHRWRGFIIYWNNQRNKRYLVQTEVRELNDFSSFKKIILRFTLIAVCIYADPRLLCQTVSIETGFGALNKFRNANCRLSL